LLRWSARYTEIRQLVRILLFADIELKKDVNGWAPVTANRDFVERAAAVVGDSRAGFGALLSLLGSAGQALLPNAVTLLSEALERTGGGDLQEEPNTAFELEVLVRKLCCGLGVSIRQRPDWHRAVLRLLDYLVEHGSHTGSRRRDYIITPFPAGG
jgi:hypothetical protein